MQHSLVPLLELVTVTVDLPKSIFQLVILSEYLTITSIIQLVTFTVDLPKSIVQLVTVNVDLPKSILHLTHLL